MKRCLLDGITTSACSPTNALHTSFHGVSGTGGRVGAANVPKDYRNVTLQSSPVRESQPEQYRTFDEYADNFTRQFEDGERIRSLYLQSPNVGNGKTTSACAILNAYLITHYVGSIQRGLTPLQRPALFVDANLLHVEYNAFNRPRVPDSIANPAAERYYKTLALAKKTPFIVLDDLGVRADVSDAFRGDLHSVINHRTVEKLATVYTSNVPMKDLPKVFGEERLYDRLRDQCIEVPFAGNESFRGLRK